MIEGFNFVPIWLSLKLSFLTTLILGIVCVPCAYFLSTMRSKYKTILEVLITMPLVLPPTVIGFYLLLLLSPHGYLGTMLNNIGLRLPFSFGGILLGSLIYNLPFMIAPIQKGFESVPQNYWYLCESFGKTKIESLLYVILPYIKNSIIMGSVLTFAHSMGEFGIILMLGGNIPGQTRVGSLAVYTELEALNYSGAHIYAAILVCISLLFIMLINVFNSNFNRNEDFK